MRLRLVKCYISECDREVVGIIHPTMNKANSLFVCRYHYEKLSQIFISPKYREGSGWFTDLTKEEKHAET